MNHKTQGTSMTSLETTTYLDTALGLHFNECSIIAADACRMAYEYAGTSKNRLSTTKLVLPNTDDGFGAITESLSVRSLLSATNNDGEAVEFLLDHTNRSFAPRLLAKLPDGIAFPLASFRRVQGSLCDFVQIGSEMNDESIVFHATSPRIAFVGAISMLLQGKQTTEHVASLLDLLADEKDRYKNNLHAMYENVVTHILQGSDEHEKPEVQKFVMLGSGDNNGSYQIDASLNFKVTKGEYKESPDDHKVELASLRTPEGAYLVVITREAFVLPLAFADKNKNVYIINEEGEYQSASTEELASIRSLFLCTKAAISQKQRAGSTLARLRKANGEKEGLFKLNLDVSKECNGILAVKYREAETERAEANQQIVDTYVSMLEFFDVNGKLKRCLGPFSPFHEKLAKLLSPLLFGKAEILKGSTVLKERMIGSIATDMYVEVEFVNASVAAVEAVVYGRPKSFVDYDMQPLLRRTINFDTEDLYETSMLEELVSIFKQNFVLQKVTPRRGNVMPNTKHRTWFRRKRTTTESDLNM